MRRFIPAALALVLLLTAGGCTKRVPVEDGTYDSTGKFVVTFADGSSLRGKIGLNEPVEVIADGHVYRGTIIDVSSDEINVQDCRLIRSLNDGRAETDRLAASRRHVDEGPLEFNFAVADVRTVERVKVDPLRTAAQSAFWTLTGVVSAFLVSEKS